MSNTIPATDQTRALLLPKAAIADVHKQQPKPCITIVVHGVDDLAGGVCRHQNGVGHVPSGHWKFSS
ncbi:MAG TPA: hypothetical protein VME63_11525 [Dyella sp.]|uniref:hypothetical protein n=1 Tax=Dyella sp. TaxID=1869338 RepID=UPI002C17A3EC|nr:hypothetical protein [Dyella sp.]HTV86032.1 hypothetical protein [Dyella sp.]